MNAIAPAPLDVPAMSQPAMIVNALVAPRKTFTALEKKPSWWMAWLLIALFSTAFLVTIDKKIGFGEITRMEMQKNPKQMERIEQLPPEKRDQAMSTAATVTKAISYVSPVISLIVFIVMAAVLLATFNFGMGAKISFNHALAIVIYGSLPGLISAVLGIVSLLAGVNTEGFNIRNPVASNPAALVDPLQHKALYTFLTTFDVFSLWSVALIGLGFAIAAKKKTSTAIVVVFCWFLLVKLIGAGFAAIS